MGKTHMLVETYSDGRVEVSNLEKDEYKAAVKELKTTQQQSNALDNPQEAAPLKSASENLPDTTESTKAVTDIALRQANLKPEDTLESLKNKTSKSRPESDVVTATPNQVKKETDEIDKFLNDLTDLSESRDTLSAKEKDRLVKQVLATISKLTNRDKIQSYQNGYRIDRVFKQAATIDIPGLQDEISELNSTYTAEFAKDIKIAIAKAQDTCDWAEVNAIFKKNTEMTRALKDPGTIKSAKSWCRLTIPVRSDLRYLREYTNRLTALSAKLDPLTSVQENLDFDLEALIDNKSKSPAELCEHFTDFNDQFRTRFIDAIDRITLNLGIIDHEKLKGLVQFTYPGGTRFSLYDRKLEFVKTGMEMLTKLKDNFTSVEKWTAPEEQLSQFEIDVKKLLVHYYRTQHHLRFLNELLEEYTEVAERSGQHIITDFSLPDEYTKKFEEGNTTFPTDDARELQDRFAKGIKFEAK